MPGKTTLEQFYQDASAFTGRSISELFPAGIQHEIGHFNVFDIADTIREVKRKSVMPYNRRTYYKISLIKGRSTAEYADKVIEIENNALLFASPKVPYHWIPKDDGLHGAFCIFTEEFMSRSKTGVELDHLELFQSGSFPVFQLDDDDLTEATRIFDKIRRELNSSYEQKYDLIRNLVMELIHLGQQLRPVPSSDNQSSATNRVTSLFLELLERQFPVESTSQRIQLRSASDYADRLAIHVNYLNKVLKEALGKTTTEIIASRVVQEAKILLKQTDWSISDIAWSLGFEEIAHFSNFFKRQTALSPAGFR